MPFGALRGKKHPDTLTSMHNLALTLLEFPERSDEAMKLMRESLQESREDVLGRRHPDTIATKHSLASGLAQSRGEASAAQIYTQRRMAARVDVLGENHPETVSTMKALATGAGC